MDTMISPQNTQTLPLNQIQKIKVLGKPDSKGDVDHYPDDQANL